MFSKILIANRGEIAVRIIRACKEMGITTVAVYSEADAQALHTNLADESYCIGAAPVRDSYLNMDAILCAAINSQAQAIHPGYGLLSENAEFAQRCKENGIVFIGPAAETISRMGDKDAARHAMIDAGVPVVEGTELLTSAKEAQAAAEKIGYPVLLKARSGGGGRGIRPVYSADGMQNAFEAARAEALSAFGDGELYMEKFLKPAKHIEVQILCDQKGKVVVLGDRDCSIQRRNQKLIEEAPAPTLEESVRQEMYKASIAAAKAVGYEGAGTIEYLLSPDGTFRFMEMNTRLQVEHSVTEMVCGIDIVKWQIRIAAGLPISFPESEIGKIGHAIECRICAEHPFTFMPGAGEIKILHVPGGMGVRFDSAIYQNYVVPPCYDSMLGKLIVYSHTREEAIRKMRSALSELVIDGIWQNSELHLEILSQEAFLDGTYSTDFMNDLTKKLGS